MTLTALPAPAPAVARAIRPRTLGTVMTVLALSACVATNYGAGRKAVILGGGLNVGMAAGYCIDQSASRETGDSAVILMGRCNTAVTASPAVLSLTVGPQASGGAIAAGNAALATFFTSEQGRATLSRSGDARDVEVLEAFDSNGIFTMRVRDAELGEYWRAVTAIRGRLVTLSAAGTEAAPLAATQGRDLLAKAMAELVKANPAPAV